MRTVVKFNGWKKDFIPGLGEGRKSGPKGRKRNVEIREAWGEKPEVVFWASGGLYHLAKAQ